jgi:octopine/nopaline transport system substrate-binding protein
MEKTMKALRCAALLLAAAALLCAPPAGAQEKPWTKLRIATEGAFKPWNFHEPGGKLVGFEIDLAEDLCRRMRLECEVSAQSFDGMIPALNAGKFDAIMAGMSVTPKREEAIAFSIPYGSTGQTFGVLKSSPLAALPRKGEVFSLATSEAEAVKAIEELKPLLKGAVVGVQGSSIAAAFLDKYLKGVVEVREYKTTEQHDLDLFSGRIDAVMASTAYLSTAAERPAAEAMVIAGPRFMGGILGKGSAVGLRKSDPELKAKFDAAITAAVADGTIPRLSQRWFGFDVTPR